MTLRDLINEVTKDKALGDYLRNFKELDKNIFVIGEMDYQEVTYFKLDNEGDIVLSNTEINFL